MISSFVIPDAKSSRSVSTGYRKPRTVGLPWQIAGSVVIRSRRDMRPMLLGASANFPATFEFAAFDPVSHRPRPKPRSTELLLGNRGSCRFGPAGDATDIVSGRPQRSGRDPPAVEER